MSTHTPWAMSHEGLAKLLEELAQRVRTGDSLEGNLSWELDYGDQDGPPQADCLVRASYRVGNRSGQGGTHIIGNIA